MDMKLRSAIDKILRSGRIDPDTLIALRSAIPSTINLQVSTSGKSFVATVKSVDNQTLPKEVFLVTQGESAEELVNMVNDLIFSYKNIPVAYRPYYKQILRPIGTVARSENLKLVNAY